MPSPQKIIDIANAFYKSQTLFAASDLGIFATLARLESADCAQISQELELDQRCCRLLLDGLCAMGLIHKSADKMYSNSQDAAMFLVPGSPADLSKAIGYNRDVYQAWAKTGQLVKTGKPVEKPQIHLGDDEERTRNFVMSMHYRALGIGQAVIPMLKLDGCRKLLDVGGGPGTYASLIAKNNPDIHCTSIDLPEISKIATALISDAGLSAQVTTIASDYHDITFPDDMDAVIFFGVLHQESPESIKKLFDKAFNALNSGGKIYIMDMMTDQSRTAPEFSALFAINMALTTDNGWVFSDDDLRNWLGSSGFTDFNVSELAPPMPHWLACAQKT